MRKLKKKKSFFYRFRRRFLHVKEAMIEDLDDEDTKVTFSIYEVIVIILISILFGIVIGYIIIYSRNLTVSSEDSKVSDVLETYHNILDNYYGDLDPDDLADAAIKGMVDSLNDPYSTFIGSDYVDSYNEKVDGSFVGIGVVVKFENDYNHIIEIYEDSPALQAGIQVDDILLEVDGHDVKGLYGEELTKLIRGKENTKVKIKVLRGDEEKVVTVKRGTIELKVVTNRVIDYDSKKIGYIKINSFAANSYSQFVDALTRLEKKKVDSLIIDVRDNPGGHLLQTKQILSLFFNKKTVLYQIEAKSKKEKAYSLSNSTRDYPVSVLINSGSASAAEILASCFQENYKKSFIIGTPSYGKGTVQISQSLSSGNSIKYTTQKWLTSKGKWIDEKGVQPDVLIEQVEEYYQNPDYNTDAIVQEALKQLKESS